MNALQRGWVSFRSAKANTAMRERRARAFFFFRFSSFECDFGFEPGGRGPQIPARFPDPSCQRRLPRWFSCYFFTLNNFQARIVMHKKSSAPSLAYGLLDFFALGVVSASRSPSTNWIPAKTIWAICGVPNSNTE